MLSFNRFQKVINRIHFECTQRILVEGGGKYDGRLARQLREQFESIHAGHLNIEKNRVDRILRQVPDRFCRLRG